jgi:hypothetical protein
LYKRKRKKEVRDNNTRQWCARSSRRFYFFHARASLAPKAVACKKVHKFRQRSIPIRREKKKKKKKGDRAM